MKDVGAEDMLTTAPQHGGSTPSAEERQWSAETLGDLFVRSAGQHIDRAALWVDECAISYRELLTYAGKIANGLVASLSNSPAALLDRSLGVLGEDRRCTQQQPFERKGELRSAAGESVTSRRCAILGSRSFVTFASIVGTVLAGQTYVPLNPRHPRERLAHILQAARVEALVVDSIHGGLARDLIGAFPRSLIVLMPGAATVPDWAGKFPQHLFLCRHDLNDYGNSVSASSQDGAYLLFTSGSTGVPKGVLVRHRNVMSYLCSAAERYQPTPEDRFTQLFDLTFDLSVHDMFLCWGAGGTLYCPSDSARIAPRYFVERHGLTFWFSVPSSAALLFRLRMLRPGDLPGLRWSLFCGEPLSRQLALAWAATAPNSYIENLYGPTEATIAITAYRLPSDHDAIRALPDIVPIGYPFPSQQAVIIGADGQLVVPGEDGELCTGGTQVTDGYWDNPDLTSQRFVRPPGCPVMPWYRTGDRVKLTSQHGLVFLGRMDRQVKVAGHRVELQEVESALRRVTFCESVAAIAWPIDRDGLARGIVAFLTNESLSSEEVLAACREILPSYMVPSSIIRLPEWPSNPNGKTDYGKLRERLTS